MKERFVSRIRTVVLAAACTVAFAGVAATAPTAASAAPARQTGSCDSQHFCWFYRGSFPTLEACEARGAEIAPSPDFQYQCNYSYGRWALLVGQYV